ncbi:hypothetical protein CesoFtcFv8_021799 [Champsocephalus esox]|uniref:Reverse transcriptase domain-containing protein n=1 Tax=Champsocephalus esox TaxID=159716 RepID=A0AAN8GIP3_9TELE|nr:hypothetical protein CesoFtcFv8_021799 [Champsocephalus esox]
MSDHHLKLNLDKTELLFLPGKDCPTLDLTINIGTSVVSPTQTARNLGVTLDNNLSITANIAATTRCCRYTLYNIRRMRPQLTQKAGLVRPVTRLLQLPPGWSTCMCHPTSAAHPECSGSPGLQPS